MQFRTWLKEQWFWLKWLLAAGSILAGYTIIASRLAKRVGQVHVPSTWKPLTDRSVAVMNPTTEQFEIVALPDDVKVDDVLAVGLTEQGGSYEVVTVHQSTDRFGVPGAGAGHDLGL